MLLNLEVLLDKESIRSLIWVLISYIYSTKIIFVNNHCTNITVELKFIFANNYFFIIFIYTYISLLINFHNFEIIFQ